jgi:hypothetical protein
MNKDFYVERQEVGKTYYKCKICCRGATLSWKNHMRTQLHLNNVALRDAKEGDPEVPSADMQPREMDRGLLSGHAHDLIIDSIALANGHENSDDSNTNAPVHPFGEVESEDYALFESVNNPAGYHKADIDWDDYLFEAITQLSDETPSRDLVKRHRVEHPNESWYPFKNREIGPVR